MLGQAALAMFYLSLATHSQLYPLLLVVPICMVLLSSTRSSKDKAATPRDTGTWREVAGWIFMFVSFLGLHYALAYITVGSNQFVRRTWGTM
jgi:hypothetical protein